VEAYVIKTEFSVNNSAKNMLGGMALHFFKSGSEIQFALDVSGEKFIGNMVDYATRLVDVHNDGIGDVACIRALTSLLGKEGGFIKDGIVTVIAFEARSYAGGKGANVGI
jgi:hypothetical protein